MKKNQRRADAKKSLNNIRGFLFGLGVNIADRIREKFPEKDRKVKRITQEERNAIVMRQRLIIGVIAALVLLYLARTIHYALHFEKNTYINGIEVSGMSLKAAAEELTAHGADGYVLTINGPEGATETISGEAVGIRVVGASHARDCLRSQNAFGWLFNNHRTKTYEIDLETEYDEEALSGRIAALAMMDGDNMRTPKNAYLAISEKGSYNIIPEDEGTELKEDEARAAIKEAAANCRKTIDLTAYQYRPEIRSGDENLVKRRDEWNGFLKASGLTYNVAENLVEFDGQKISSLLVDDGESVTLSMDKIRDLVAQWKYDYDTYHHQFSFTTYYGKTVMIEPYGNYGYEVDDETLPAEIYERISAGDRGTYDAPYYHEPLYHTNRGLGGNYVEINVDLQHMWVWKDGQVVVDTDVVTGSPVYGRTTYYGCYAIDLMDTNVTLGDVNVEGYAEEVRYWVRFNGGEGIHDAPWRDNFGGRIWIYNGSHGCVNVPEWVMGDVYDNVQMGEAVVVYGSEYDESVHTKGDGQVNTEYYEKRYDEGKLQY